MFRVKHADPSVQKGCFVLYNYTDTYTFKKDVVVAAVGVLHSLCNFYILVIMLFQSGKKGQGNERPGEGPANVCA